MSVKQGSLRGPWGSLALKLWGRARQKTAFSRAYTVSFGSVSGYIKPGDQIVTLAAGESKTVIGFT